MEKIKNFFKDESGVSAVEYALMAAVVASLLLAGLTIFYQGLQDIFEDIIGIITGQAGGGGGEGT